MTSQPTTASQDLQRRYAGRATAAVAKRQAAAATTYPAGDTRPIEVGEVVQYRKVGTFRVLAVLSTGPTYTEINAEAVKAPKAYRTGRQPLHMWVRNDRHGYPQS